MGESIEVKDYNEIKKVRKELNKIVIRNYASKLITTVLICGFIGLFAPKSHIQMGFGYILCAICLCSLVKNLGSIFITILCSKLNTVKYGWTKHQGQIINNIKRVRRRDTKPKINSDGEEIAVKFVLNTSQLKPDTNYTVYESGNITVGLFESTEES